MLTQKEIENQILSLAVYIFMIFLNQRFVRRRQSTLVRAFKECKFSLMLTHSETASNRNDAGYGCTVNSANITK
jgi:hypothetical protein